MEKNTFTSSFFRKQSVDKSRINAKWRQYLPKTGFKEQNGIIAFDFDKLEYPYCYEISSLLLSVKFKIVDENGALPQPTDNVVGINNMLHSLFTNVVLSINGEKVTTGGTEYHWRAYLQNLMNYDNTVKKSWLQSAGYGDDNPGFFNQAKGEGYLARAVHFRKNQDFEFKVKDKDGTFRHAYSAEGNNRMKF